MIALLCYKALCYLSLWDYLKYLLSRHRCFLPTDRREYNTEYGEAPQEHKAFRNERASIFCLYLESILFLTRKLMKGVDSRVEKSSRPQQESRAFGLLSVIFAVILDEGAVDNAVYGADLLHKESLVVFTEHLDGQFGLILTQRF